MSKNNNLEEALLDKWLLITTSIKNNRIVKELPSTEAMVLHLLINNYPNSVSVQYLIDKSKMLKSQMNRTIKSLENKAYIEMTLDEKDKRCKRISITTLGQNIIDEIHKISIKACQDVISIIGEEDSKKLLSIFDKIIAHEEKK